jgi:hypothetical protein
VIRMAGLTVTIVRTTESGLPADVTFQFDVPLEHPSLKWFALKRGEGLVPFSPPVIGESVDLPADFLSSLPMVMRYWKSL